jgi:transcriptional regulator with XRE-family HTH domain
MNNIKGLRQYKKLSQKELAEKLFVDQTAVSNWENGKNSISPETAKKISEIFGVPLEFVYGYEPDGYSISYNNLRESYKEDISNAPVLVQKVLLFKYLGGFYRQEKQIVEEERQKETPPELSDGEKALLDKFSRVPAEQRTMFFEMLEVFLKNRQ